LKHCSEADVTTVGSGPVEISVIAQRESITLRRCAISLIEGHEGGKDPVCRYTEYRADEVRPPFGSGSVKIAAGIHDNLALWIGPIGSIEGAESGQCSVRGKTKYRAGINLSSLGGCAVKVTILANRQPGPWPEAICAVE